MGGVPDAATVPRGRRPTHATLVLQRIQIAHDDFVLVGAAEILESLLLENGLVLSRMIIARLAVPPRLHRRENILLLQPHVRLLRCCVLPLLLSLLLQLEILRLRSARVFVEKGVRELRGIMGTVT